MPNINQTRRLFEQFRLPSGEYSWKARPADSSFENKIALCKYQEDTRTYEWVSVDMAEIVETIFENDNSFLVMDDFQGGLLGDFWSFGDESGGTIYTLTDQPLGILRLDTSAIDSRNAYIEYANMVFNNDNEWVFESYVKSYDAITNRRIVVGMRSQESNDDYIAFVFDTDVDSDNIYLETNNAGAGAIQTDSGVDLVADTFYKFKIKVFSDESFEAYINDTRVASSHAGTIQDTSFVPFFYIDNKAVSQQNYLDIDYCKVRMNRTV